MAVLNREGFLEILQKFSGDDDSDEMLNCIADMTETFDTLQNSDADKYKVEAEEWKSKYEENDKQWRAKYKNAFFNYDKSDNDYHSPREDSDRGNTGLHISDLFK